MKKELSKKIIMMIMIVGLIATQVFASGPVQIPGIGAGTNTTANTTANTTTNTTTNTTQNTQTPVVTTNTTTNTAGSTYTNNQSLPQTGDASDYAIFALIAVCGIFAIYTFKKVRDYNV